MRSLVVAGLMTIFAATRAWAGCDAVLTESDFSAGDDGWTHTGATLMSWFSAGGNPTGFLHIDNSEGPITYIFAPAKFRGNLLACNGGTIGFDGNMLGTGGSGYTSSVDYGHLTIFGTGGLSATADLVPGTAPGNTPPVGAWASYQVPFTATAFGVTPTQWNAIIGNVTQVRLSVEALFGNEIQGIDNVRLIRPLSGTPSLPGAVGPYALGAALLLGLAYALRRLRS